MRARSLVFTASFSSCLAFLWHAGGPFFRDIEPTEPLREKLAGAVKLKKLKEVILKKRGTQNPTGLDELFETIRTDSSFTVKDFLAKIDIKDILDGKYQGTATCSFSSQLYLAILFFESFYTLLRRSLKERLRPKTILKVFEKIISDYKTYIDTGEGLGAYCFRDDPGALTKLITESRVIVSEENTPLPLPVITREAALAGKKSAKEKKLEKIKNIKRVFPSASSEDSSPSKKRKRVDSRIKMNMKAFAMFVDLHLRDSDTKVCSWRFSGFCAYVFFTFRISLGYQESFYT